MLGIILVLTGTFFEEISDSIGKRKAEKHEESVYSMVFLSIFWGTIFFSLFSIIKTDGFVFSLASLPTFSARAALEMLQMYISVFAIIKADRSTFGFFRTATIPALLLVDLSLGYTILFLPLIGMGIITMSLWLIFLNKTINKNGANFALFSAINAVATISLYKYNITHYNSVAAEQLLMNSILLVFFLFMALTKSKENPLAFLLKPIFFFQSFSAGLASIIESFAYNYAAASIITSAKRSSAIFWSFLSGQVYFKERHFILKFFIFSLLLLGLALLALN